MQPAFAKSPKSLELLESVEVLVRELVAQNIGTDWHKLNRVKEAIKSVKE